MTLKETLARLKSMSNEKTMAHNRKFGLGDNQFGVKMGDIRALAGKIKTDQALAMELWETGNLDAQLLAVLITDTRKLTKKELEKMVQSAGYAPVADWLYSYVVKVFPDKESFRTGWMNGRNKWAARAGWSLTAGNIARDPALVDIQALLDRIESEMPAAPPEVQWTMNTALANIGIHHEKHRQRAIAIGEKLGIYRDYPVSKGCTSPFAPVWIGEMVKRQQG
ncbi:DNA alkylation repair protein [Sediminibacterium soli]|uniref:DNA alkylation repair protein n=1 Tax=Sediminibacterium soli TaxID=2698829 RepID=UPI001379623D|nr:DNA alkylation repair protein [Sediminibacterium soli]NCI46512.1 DNA alkylation repair protein [Sediminibacterium soli]